jgi:hypothetical protein
VSACRGDGGKRPWSGAEADLGAEARFIVEVPKPSEGEELIMRKLSSLFSSFEHAR